MYSFIQVILLLKKLSQFLLLIPYGSFWCDFIVFIVYFLFRLSVCYFPLSDEHKESVKHLQNACLTCFPPISSFSKLFG